MEFFFLFLILLCLGVGLIASAQYTIAAAVVCFLIIACFHEDTRGCFGCAVAIIGVIVLIVWLVL